jgi:hypothetical protein
MSETKNGDGFDISGNVTTTKAMGGIQGLYFAFPADETHHSTEWYSLVDFFNSTLVSLTGHVSPTKADVTFTVTTFHWGSDPPFATLQYVFSGQPWKDGAQLVTTGDKPTTTGALKMALPGASTAPNATSTGTPAADGMKTIIGAVTGGGVLVLVIAIGIVLCCCVSTASRCIWCCTPYRRTQKVHVVTAEPYGYYQGQYQMVAPPSPMPNGQTMGPPPLAMPFIPGTHLTE